MTLDELIAETRRIIDDTASPAQWSNAELTRYLSEGQDTFARQTLCLVDDTTVLSLIVTEPDKNRYALSQLILKVYAVEDGDCRFLHGIPSNHVSARETGKPRRFTLRNDPHSLFLWPTPDDVYSLRLLVARRPLEPLESGGDEPEIPEEFHLMLCDWAAYRALRMADPDSENIKASDRAQEAWWMQLRDAKREMYRFNTISSVPNLLRGSM